MERREEVIHLLSSVGTYELMLEAIGIMGLAGYTLETYADEADAELPTEQPFPGLATQLHVEISATEPPVSRQQLEEAFCYSFNRVLKVHAN